MTRPITAGVDGTAESHAALAWAAREAVRRDLALRVVHVWQLVPDQAFGAGTRETHDQWVREGWTRPRGASPNAIRGWT